MPRLPALHGLRVLDLTRVLAGPWCTQNLADLGADVIKIEHPGRGDDTRGWGPPYLRDGQGADTSEAAYYLSMNRNKRSVALDFTTGSGRALVREMAASCDILVENYKVGGLAKYGLDYESLRALNPRLIYCSITGFGQDGPYAARPGYDFMIQGMGGLMSITGERDDLPTNLYGPGDNYHLTHSHVIPALLRRFHEARQRGAERVAIWGSGRPRREFLHVDDLARACLLTMQAQVSAYRRCTGPDGTHLNVGSGDDISIRELAGMIAAVVGCRAAKTLDGFAWFS